MKLNAKEQRKKKTKPKLSSPLNNSNSEHATAEPFNSNTYISDYL
jgi:hypothetical protein